MSGRSTPGNEAKQNKMTKQQAQQTYTEIIADCKEVETTERGGNSYPRRLRRAYTADTIGELRDLVQAAQAAGHKVSVLYLHRRDGWALWERYNTASDHDLEDDYFQAKAEDDWTITITNESDAKQEAFLAVCGEGYPVDDAQDLFRRAKQVRYLASELPDPANLEDGESVVVFMDANNRSINYTVATGQNGYGYDTHEWCLAVEVEEVEEEEKEEA